MASVLPFRAFRYDPRLAEPVEVLTQPYDKITPGMQDRYYAASPYNLVRVILGRRKDTDNKADNVYSRAATSFREWKQKGILRQDSAPSFYCYSQRFVLPGAGAELERRGFTALGRLEDYSAGIVFRHEQTLAKPKADRLELLRATRAHFEQLFMLYEDSGEIDGLLSQRGDPTTSVTDEYGVLHSVWQISEPSVIESVCAKMRDQKLIIADGHHRYETALAYRDECREDGAHSPHSSSDQSPRAYEYVMMTFVNMKSPGLVILPTHRVVRSLDSFSADAFRDSSRTFFDVEEVEPSFDAAGAVTILSEAGRAGTALLAVTADRAFLIHKPQDSGSRNSIFAGSSLRQQSLDVAQLHK
ncbi:MAG: DUF1015 domain-containing protein, partial [Candidatus Sulfotelmatobacter sp.]